MSSAILGLGDWLAELGVARVVMEATSDPWRAPLERLQKWPVTADVWLVGTRCVTQLAWSSTWSRKPAGSCR